MQINETEQLDNSELQSYPSTLEEKRQYARDQAIKFLQSNPGLNVKSLKPTLPSKLSKIDLSKKEMAQINLDPVIKSILCGTIICDGSIAISKGYANARIQMRHSTRQTEWFMWKAFYAFPNITEKSIVFQKPDGYQANSPAYRHSPGEILGKWKISSGATAELTALHTIICRKGNKKMERFWLNHMNDYFLMTIWLDDGGLIDHRQGVIAFYYLSQSELQVFADYMLAVWDIKCNVVAAPSRATKTNPNPFQVNLADLDNLEKLLRIVAKIVPVKSMLYKVCLYPIESSHLQRWTSELKTLVRQEWHADIDQIYSDIAQKKI